MVRRAWALILAGASLLPHAAAAEGRVPLEKQFFDFFDGRCVTDMQNQLRESGKDPEAPRFKAGVETYCACTAQALVSRLSAEEILAFANDPTHEPGASKIRPYFEQCRDQVRAQQGTE
jgi:hypothetical protein